MKFASEISRAREELPGAGIEPALLAEEDFKSSASAIPPSGRHVFYLRESYIIRMKNAILI